jgi:hypothetical protein
MDHHPERLEVVSVPAGFTANLGPASADANTFRLDVTSRADAPCGQIKDKVSLRAYFDSGASVTRSVILKGGIQDDLQALPASVLVGICPLGQTQTRSVTLQSGRGDSFRVESVDTSTPSLRVRAAEPNPRDDMAQNHLYAVEFTPEHRGQVREKITLRLRTASGREHAMEVPIHGYVTSPAVASQVGLTRMSQAQRQDGVRAERSATDNRQGHETAKEKENAYGIRPAVAERGTMMFCGKPN